MGNSSSNITLHILIYYYKLYGRNVTTLVDHINYSTQSTMSDKSFSYTSLFRGKKKIYMNLHYTYKADATKTQKKCIIVFNVCLLIFFFSSYLFKTLHAFGAVDCSLMFNDRRLFTKIFLSSTT